LGNLSFVQHNESFHKPYSEKTAEMIDEEVRQMVEVYYQRTKELLLGHRDDLERVAKELLAKEIIFKTDLVALLGPRPFDKLDVYDEYMANGEKSDLANKERIENIAEEVKNDLNNAVEPETAKTEE